MVNNTDISELTGSLAEAHQAVFSAQEDYRTLVNSVKDYAIFMLTADGRVKTWNPGAQLTKGYTANEIIGQHISRFYTREDKEAGRPEYLLNIARTQGRVEDEGYRVRKDGSLFWADVIITAIVNDDGEVIGFSKVTRDLTQKREIEEQLRQSEERFRLLTDAVKEYAIFMLDPQGYILTWNEGAKRIKGYTQEEIIGKHFSTFYSEDLIKTDFPGYELRYAIENGQFQGEGWRIRKDGSQFWANVTLTTIYDAQGKHIGFSKVTRDLTDKKRTEEQLKTSELRFRLLIESVKDYAIYMLDPEGKIATWNAGAQRIKGYRAEEIIGRHFSIFYPEEILKIKYPEYELKVARETGRFEDEGWRIRKDGSRFWANVTITAVFNESGELLGFGKVTRDLTDRKLAEDKLRYLNENLELLVEERTHALLQEKTKADEARAASDLANKRKDQFLANMCHETFTPMNHILGFAEMLQGEVVGPLNEKQQRYINNIVYSGKHLHELLRDLLDIAKIQEGQVTLKYESFNLSHLVDEVRYIFEKQAAESQVSVQYTVQPDLDFISADRTRFKQILINLISNAIKYNKENGWVTVRLSKSEDEQSLVCEVRDSGIGISEEMLPHVFTPFFQADTSAARQKEGSGLGASITKHLVELHQGTITIDSTLDVGTTVTFKIPLQAKG